MNTTNTTRKVRLNCNFNLLRTSLQGALDAMDTLLYAEQGNVETPAYIKKAVDMAEDKEQVILNAEQDLFDNIDAADSLAEKVLRRFIEGTTEQQPAPQIFEAECYLFPQKKEHFGINDWELARKGAQLGLAYEADEPIVHVFFRTAGEIDDNISWQDHQIPASVQSALKLDQDYGHFAPTWIPLWIVQEIAKNGYCDLKPNELVTIRLRPYPGQDLKETLDSIW